MILFKFSNPNMDSDLIGESGKIELYKDIAVIAQTETQARVRACRRIKSRPDIDPSGYLMHDWKLCQMYHLPPTWDSYWL